jgi:hypothetical protein
MAITLLLPLLGGGYIPLAQATGRAEDDLFESRIPGDINGSSPTRRRTSLSYARVTTSSTGCSWSLTPGSGTCSASI